MFTLLMTIKEMAKMAIVAKLAIIEISSVNFYMVIRAIQLKKKKEKSSMMLNLYEQYLLFRNTQYACNFVIFRHIYIVKMLIA